MKKLWIKILFIIVIIGNFNSCNPTKRVLKHEHMLVKNDIIVNGEKKTSELFTNLIYQKPNKKLLFKFPLRLHIYNLARPNRDSIFEAWLNKKPNRRKWLKNIYSQKQADRIKESVLNFNSWLKKVGEAPTIVDGTLTAKSLKRLQAYFWNNGWFDVSADVDTKTNTDKTAEVAYNITTGTAYLLDSISSTISTPIIDSLYRKTLRKNSYLKKGERFKVGNIEAEQDRISDVLKNQGFYHFKKEAVYFEVDTIGKNKKVNIDIQIKNRAIRNEDSTIYSPFKQFKIKNVNIYTNKSFSNRLKKVTDTTYYKNYALYSIGKLKYKPKALTDAIFISPSNHFKDIDKARTYKHLSELKVFKYPNIEYTENKDTTLTANIYLEPLKKMIFNIETEVSQSNIQAIGFGINTGLTIRNIFKGAETFKISGFTAIGANKEGLDSRDRFFDINELGIDFKLSFPRLFSPFNTDRIIPKTMFPTTDINLSASSQTNIGLDKQAFQGAFNYTWHPSNKITHKIDVFNINYILNKNIERYFNIYPSAYNSLNAIAANFNIDPQNVDEAGNLKIDFISPDTPISGADNFAIEVILGLTNLTNQDTEFKTVNNILERKTRLTENNLILASNYTFELDKRESIVDKSFSTFRFKIEAAGNLLKTFSSALNLNKDNLGRPELFNVAFSQYVKTDIDYTKHWDLGFNNTLAFRTFIGYAIPIGNSSSIPFSKSYFAGGANDNRAWRAYGLGPGDSNSINDFNEANFKLALNLEYRFPILGQFNGALFIDAGNIWDISSFSKDFDAIFNENTTFTGFRSLKNIAIGSGFGIRYDFGFVVLRGDIGFKTYDPKFKDENRWFNNYNFADAVYNIGINYPF